MCEGDAGAVGGVVAAPIPTPTPTPVQSQPQGPANLTQAQNNVKTADANVKTAQAQLDAAQEALADAHVKAVSAEANGELAQDIQNDVSAAEAKVAEAETNLANALEDASRAEAQLKPFAEKADRIAQGLGLAGSALGVVGSSIRSAEDDRARQAGYDAAEVIAENSLGSMAAKTSFEAKIGEMSNNRSVIRTQQARYSYGSPVSSVRTR